MIEKNANPLVSVIVPVFNMEKYIKRCLYSLNVQTYGEIEIIIVNDGSTDGSSTIIEDFRSISRFSLLVINQENLGLGAARNIGFKHANGKYVAFFDSDDFVSSRLCEFAVKCALDTQADVVEFGYLTVNSESFDKSFDTSNDAEIISKRKAIIGLSPMACNKLYSKKLLLKAKLNFPHISHEDEAEIYRLLIFTDRIVRMHKKLYYYYQRADSITGIAVNSRTVDLLKVADILFDIAKKYPLYYCEFVYKSIAMLYRCRNMWELLNEEWSNRALETTLGRLKEMEPFEHDNPYFFVAKEISQEYENSNSWRLTKPMRGLSQILEIIFSRKIKLRRKKLKG